MSQNKFFTSKIIHKTPYAKNLNLTSMHDGGIDKPNSKQRQYTFAFSTKSFLSNQ